MFLRHKRCFLKIQFKQKVKTHVSIIRSQFSKKTLSSAGNKSKIFHSRHLNFNYSQENSPCCRKSRLYFRKNATKFSRLYGALRTKIALNLSLRKNNFQGISMQWACKNACFHKEFKVTSAYLPSKCVPHSSQRILALEKSTTSHSLAPKEMSCVGAKMQRSQLTDFRWAKNAASLGN